MNTKFFDHFRVKRKTLSDYKKNRLEFRYSSLDMVLKIVGPVLGLIIGIAQYFYFNAIQERKNFEREFWLRKFDVYGELSTSIGEILGALEYNDTVTLTTTRSFRTVYWKSTLVEDTIVVPALTEFNNSLLDYFNEVGTSSSTLPENDTLKEERIRILKSDIEEAGNTVMSLCKQSLEKQIGEIDE